MSNKNIETKVEALIKDIIKDLGYDLYDIEYVKEGKDFYLRIFIDSKNGIGLNDCEIVNNAIEGVLDEADYIKEQYFLEISSTGVERNLRKDKHFADNIGKKIELNLYKKIYNKKSIVGILKNYSDEEIEVQLEEKNIKVNIKDIASAKVIYEWNKEE